MLPDLGVWIFWSLGLCRAILVYLGLGFLAFSRWVARGLADDDVDGLLVIWFGLGNSFSSLASRLYWGSCFGCAGIRFCDIFVSLDCRWF